MNVQCAEYWLQEACQQKWGPVLRFDKPTNQESGPVLPEVVRVKPLVVRDWFDLGRAALYSMNKGQSCDFAQAVLTLARAHWVEIPTRACVLNIFSLVATLLAASEDKTPTRSGRCASRQMWVRGAGRGLAALVFATCAPVVPSFLAAKSNG